MKATTRHPLVPVILLVAFSSMMISCTKEVPYKYEYKEKVHAKSELDTNAEYMFVASSDLTNHADADTSGASPYWQGSEKIVKFRFTEKSLQAFEVDDETRLKDNVTNDKIAFEIPISHVEYRCAQDRYKKCKNEEEENNEIVWSKKTQFKPDFEGMKTIGASLLPVEMDQVFGTSCFSETSSRFVGYELKDDALNIQVEKVFQGDMTCLEKKGVQISKLGDLTSQIIYHYSFAKLNKMTSPGYKAVSYPNSDENLFGFFTTETRKYDVAFNRLEKMKTQLMNRWNPDRKVIEYYLTDNFDKPEYAVIKQATQTAFDRVNAGLASAGVDLKLVLKGTGSKSPGDIRNSMIVLVEDPIAAGPLGYGPSVVNPRTGEILSARTAMYYGNLLSGIKMTYDEVVREVRREKANLKTGNKQANLSLSTEATGITAISKEIQENVKEGAIAAKRMQARLAQVMVKNATQKRSKPVATSQSKSSAAQWSVEEMKNLTSKQVNRMLMLSDKKSMAKDRLSAMSKYCNYPSELFPFNQAVKNGLQGSLGKELKLWKDLTEGEKEKVIALIAPEIWVPTLVHELGHNLGLRHNFGGSEDKDNFYTKEELHKMGVTHKVPYSSVMDYGYSELNILPTLGKYDIAALRFGYKREVELKDNKFLKLNDKTVGEFQKEAKATANPLDIKDYQYCSDEHVDVNPNCKRFDEGTTPLEMVAFAEKSYGEMYSVRNFRNGRENFSVMGDTAYAEGVRKRFGYVRAYMERYERVANLIHAGPDDENWEKIPWMKEVKDAALASGRFFLNVLMVPDLQCAIAKVSNPRQIVEVGDINLFSQDDANCFELELNPEYIVVAQTGKAFNNRKSATSENNYADQIDVRGMYIDKLVAMENLFQRRTGNSIFDKYEDNYMDTELQPEIMQTMLKLLMNKLTVQAPFVNAAGEVVGTFEIRPSVFSAPKENAAAFPSHWINAPLSEDVAKAVGVPNRNVSFQEMMLKIIKDSLTTTQGRAEDSTDYMGFFSVIKTSKAYQLDQNLDGIFRDIGSIRYIATRENAFAGMAMDNIAKAELLGVLTKEDFEQLEKEIKAIEAAKKQAAKNEAALKEAMKGSALQETAANIPKLSDKFSADYEHLTSRDLSDFRQGIINPDQSSYLLTILPASN